MANPGNFPELQYQKTHVPGQDEPSFEEALREYLRSAPWLLVSIAFHLVLFFVLNQFAWEAPVPEEKPVAITATMDEQEIDPIEPEEPPPPEEKEIEEVEEVVDDPVVTETVEEEVVDSEFDTDQPLSDMPFVGKGMNDVLGVGGGAGGYGGGGKYGRRGSKGGGSASQKAVEWGLEWLKRHQDPRGFWSSRNFSNMCQKNTCSGEGEVYFDVGVTGLSLLAFLGAGNTPNTGKYKDVVRKGVKYLTEIQDPETGCFGEVGSHNEFLYDHALATLAVTEAYGLSKMPMLKDHAQKGIDFILSARNPYKAWRYAYPPDGQNDVSVTGWMVMCLKSAEDFKLKVDHAALDGARTLIDELTDDTTWRTGYIDKGGWSAREPGTEADWPHENTEAMTAVAMLCRIFLGEEPGSDALRGGAELLRKQLPKFAPKFVDYYYWYYGSYAMFQLGGSDWDTWQAKMVDAVVKTQRTDGDELGSWDPEADPWGKRGGRVYSTAIMTLCLEVYYRYDRVLGAR